MDVLTAVVIMAASTFAWTLLYSWRGFILGFLGVDARFVWFADAVDWARGNDVRELLLRRLAFAAGLFVGVLALTYTLIVVAFDRVGREIVYRWRKLTQRRKRTSVDIECRDPNTGKSLIGVSDGVSPTYFVELPRE